MLGPRVVLFQNRMCKAGLELEMKVRSSDIWVKDLKFYGTKIPLCQGTDNRNKTPDNIT